MGEHALIVACAELDGQGGAVGGEGLAGGISVGEADGAQFPVQSLLKGQ